MTYSVVLDACVLYPASLRDALLRFADAEFYDVLWSARILDEAERNLIADGRVSAEGARRLRSKMAEAFDGACVGAAAIAGLESAMISDPKDRHVLAAAVASQAQAVITMNLKDFPEAASAPYGIEILHPDEFFMVLYGLDARLVVHNHAPGRRPSEPADDGHELLDKLKVTVPTFAAAIRSHLPADPFPRSSRYGVGQRVTNRGPHDKPESQVAHRTSPRSAAALVTAGPSTSAATPRGWERSEPAFRCGCRPRLPCGFEPMASCSTRSTRRSNATVGGRRLALCSASCLRKAAVFASCRRPRSCHRRLPHARIRPTRCVSSCSGVGGCARGVWAQHVLASHRDAQ